MDEGGGYSSLCLILVNNSSGNSFNFKN